MSEPPDPESLARRFLDLWQDQMTAVAGDPQLAEAMARWISISAPAMAAFLPLMEAGLKGRPVKEERRDTTGRDRTGATPPPAGSSAAAAASGSRGLDLDECTRRLASLE